MIVELRAALRALRAWRFGAAAAIVTLAIGIGAATSMYAIVRLALSSTIPDIDDIPALGRIYASSRAVGVERSPLSASDAGVLAAAMSFESVGAYATVDGEMTTGDQSETIQIGYASRQFFPVMRARAATGRLFSDSDFRDAAPTAVVSNRIWRTRFAGLTIGEARLTIDGTSRTIVGVLPPEFGFSFIGIGADAWIPLPSGTDRRVSVIARLKPEVTWVAASAELGALAHHGNPSGVWTWLVIPLEQDIQKRTVGGFAMMFGPALVVLLIGCTNVACMLLARGIDRDIELSVRSALGATRWRLIRQLIGESVVLAVLGGALGIGLAHLLVRSVTAAMAEFRPEAAALAPASTLLLTMGFCFSLGACVVFGTLPAVRLSRRDLATALKGGTAPAVARFAGYRARDLVVFVELALAVALVVTTAMLIRFFVELQRVTPLFPADHLIVVEVPAREMPAVAERVTALPGISSFAVVSELPGSERSRFSAVRVEAENAGMGRAGLIGVDSSFFRTFGIPILRGRGLDQTDVDARAKVVVISEALASRLWPGQDAIGARLTVTTRTGATSETVVGVSRNALDAGGLMRTGLLAPDIYVPIDSERSTRLLLVARTGVEPAVLIRAVREAARTGTTDRSPQVARAIADDIVRSSR